MDLSSRRRARCPHFASALNVDRARDKCALFIGGSIDAIGARRSILSIDGYLDILKKKNLATEITEVTERSHLISVNSVISVAKFFFFNSNSLFFNFNLYDHIGVSDLISQSVDESDGLF